MVRGLNRVKAALRTIKRTIGRKEPRYTTTNMVFVHMPKCGGSSLHGALTTCFHPQRIVRMSASGTMEAAKWLNRGFAELRRELLVVELVQSGGGRLLSGHWTVDDRVCQEFCQRYQFVTLLREPVERWFSQYFYNRYKTKTDHCRIVQSLDQFIGTAKASDQGNMYVRHLTAGTDAAPDDADAACRTLDYFSHVGLLEHVDAFVATLGKMFGRPLELGQTNVNPHPQEERAELMRQYRSEVEQLCQPDIAVYQYAIKRLEKERCAGL